MFFCPQTTQNARQMNVDDSNDNCSPLNAGALFLGYLITLFSLNVAKNQEPYFASIKFRDFERKLDLK